MKNIYFLCLIAMLVVSCGKNSPENQATIETRIFDEANLLTPSDEKNIFNVIKSVEEETGSQIGIVTIDTLNGERIEDFSLNRANELRLGRKDINDGVLITVSLKDKKMRLEVGDGLDHVITNQAAARIVEEEMGFNFMHKDYAVGVLSAVDAIKKLIQENEDLVGK